MTKIEVRMVFSVVKSFLTDQGHTPVKTFCQNWIFSTQKYAATFVYFFWLFTIKIISFLKKEHNFYEFGAHAKFL